MNRWMLLGHVCLSLMLLLAVIRLRHYFDLPSNYWYLGLLLLMYWLGVFTSRRSRAK